ncbi:hypothetical protein [Lelliottia jeotgali]
MPTQFPEALDTFDNPRPDSSQSAVRTHSQQHGDANDSLEALQLKVGVDMSSDPESLDFKVGALENVSERLGTAAFEDGDSFATAQQGQLAGSAVQPNQLNEATTALQTELQVQIDGLIDGQQTQAIYADTLADLQAVVGTYEGQGAFVLNGAGAGQYRWSSSDAEWQFLRADTLAQKADKSAVADVAGVLVSSIRRDFIEADQDPQGNVAFAVHRDGTREFIGAKVGGYRISRDGEDSALITGRADNRGVYQEYAQDLAGTAFADALEIDIDELGRVGRVKWKEGSDEAGNMRGRYMSDFRIAGINARVVTSDGYGTGRDTLMILCHGNTKNYTYAPNDAFKAWARANRVSYASISLQEGGTTGWGNDLSRNRVVALYHFLMARYKFHPSIVLAGDSMGGLVMGQLAYYKPIPIRFCLGIGPVPSLNYIFANAPARQAAIRSAFGMAADGSDDSRVAEFFTGYDWFNMGLSGGAPQRKLGFPRMHIYAGSGDSTYAVDFGGDLNYPILRDSIRAAGGFCNLTIVPGVSHDNDVLWNNVLEDGVFLKEIG